MSDTVACRHYGRDFTVGEMALLQALIAGPPKRNRSQVATEFCHRTGWLEPDGGLKTMMAKCAMLRRHRDRVITLSAATRPPRRTPRVSRFGAASEPPPSPAPATLDAGRPIRPVPITGAGRKASRVWNEFIARDHYLGYKTLVGARMRYAVHDRDGRPQAMLGYFTATWKPPRDAFIGWPAETRARILHRMIDNSRFLILPWIRIPNLASHILSVVRRLLPLDWRRQYNVTPVLMETSVEIPRFTGATYRAPDGSGSEQRKDAGASIRTGNAGNRKMASGSARSGKTGKEPSTADQNKLKSRKYGTAARRTHPSA